MDQMQRKSLERVAREILVDLESHSRLMRKFITEGYDSTSHAELLDFIDGHGEYIPVHNKDLPGILASIAQDEN